MRSGHVVMVKQKRANLVIMLEHMCFMQQQLILKNAEWGW
jgi:hypothetical protein